MTTENPYPLTASQPRRYALTESDGILYLVDNRNSGFKPIFVEFPAFLASARGLAEIHGQPLIRAIGRTVSTVVDATAGMGQDSFMLAAAGYHVIGLERSAEISALLVNGLERARSDPEISRVIGDRLEFINADAIKELPRLDPPPEAIYLDPMYPPKRKKSALSRKEMQIFRDLVGGDPDADQLFQVASRTATNRVVVKRPAYADPVAGKPTMSYEGKLVRFDVYRVS